MDPLTDEQHAELTADLRALERALKASIDAASGVAKPVSLDEPIGRVSRIDAIQHQRMASAGREANKIRLSQVRRALTAGDAYGFCVRCEEPIGFRRLKVKPEAPFCIRCQGARER